MFAIEPAYRVVTVDLLICEQKGLSKNMLRGRAVESYFVAIFEQ